MEIECDCDGATTPYTTWELREKRSLGFTRCKETGELIWPFQKRYYLLNTYIGKPIDSDYYFNHKGIMIKKLRGDY